jgi:hypothetical protein
MGMGDVKFSPKETAALLDKLDEGAKQMSDARKQVYTAMAERRTAPPAKTNRSARKKR